MRVPFGWGLPVIALIAVGVAIWAGTNFSISVPAAGAAVVAAALLIREAASARGDAPPPRGETTAITVPPRRTVRATFAAGRLGREEIVVLLDTLERKGPNPMLPGRPASEVDRLARLPPAEFRAYLRRRLDDLEGRS